MKRKASIVLLCVLMHSAALAFEMNGVRSGMAYQGYVRDTCNKWSQDISDLKTVVYNDALLYQLKPKSMAG